MIPLVNFDPEAENATLHSIMAAWIFAGEMITLAKANGPDPHLRVYPGRDARLLNGMRLANSSLGREGTVQAEPFGAKQEKVSAPQYTCVFGLGVLAAFKVAQAPDRTAGMPRICQVALAG